jgi:hypothetical protein
MKKKKKKEKKKNHVRSYISGSCATKNNDNANNIFKNIRTSMSSRN